MTVELKPCPFCGKDPQQVTRFVEAEEVGYLAARCSEHTKWITVEQWNRRVSQPAALSNERREYWWCPKCEREPKDSEVSVGMSAGKGLHTICNTRMEIRESAAQPEKGKP